MCTYATVKTELAGQRQGPGEQGGLAITDGTVYFDHPVHAMAEHTLNIDFAGPGQRPRRAGRGRADGGVGAGAGHGNRGGAGIGAGRAAGLAGRRGRRARTPDDVAPTLPRISWVSRGNLFTRPAPARPAPRVPRPAARRARGPRLAAPLPAAAYGASRSIVQPPPAAGV